MAFSKLAILSICVALVFTHVRADASVDGEAERLVEVVRSDDSELSDLKVQLNELTSKIDKLESDLDEKNKELKKKDEVIAQNEKIISAKLDAISLLESEIASLEENEKLNAEEQVGKAYAHALELERQVNDLKRQLDILNGEKESWVTLANEAEKKADEASLKSENFQKILKEQKTRIRVTEQALEVSKEETRKAKFEAASKMKELTEVHGAWLPPWLASHYAHFQFLITTHWNEHAKPAIDVVIQKVKAWDEAQAAKGAEHVETVKAEVKKFSKPYIDHVASVTKPYVEKVRVALKPFMEELVRAHREVQGAVKESLNNNNDEFTRRLTTEELESFTHFAASALLTLSFILLVKIFSAIFWNQSKKPTQNTNVHHARRKV